MKYKIADKMTDKSADEMAGLLTDEVGNIEADEVADVLTDDMQLSAQSNNEDTDATETETSITNVTELSNAEESNYPETENLNKFKSMFSSIPDLSGRSNWYTHKCFKRYWDHYNYVMSWCRKHHETCNKLKEKQTVNLNRNQKTFFSQNSWHYGVPQSHPYWSGFPRQQGQSQTAVKVNSKARRRRLREKKKKNVDPDLKEGSEDEEQTGVSGSDAFEMEITEDMIEFFSKSEKHRKQRDEQKKEDRQNEKKEPELINLEDVQASPQRERTVEAPKERPGTRRTSEMKQLYGKGAAMIHGMETAVQMTFDRNKDLKQPKLWPNMPLKIVFN